MRRAYILIFCLVFSFLITACESESDKRKAKIERLEKEIEVLEKNQKTYDDFLNSYDRVNGK